MDFALNDYLDEDACYAQLIALLHPDGLSCPGCGERQRLGIHHRPAQLLMILRGIAQGTPTAQMARELGCDRRHLLQWRHRLQEHAHSKGRSGEG